jgi:hypothetical protein
VLDASAGFYIAIERNVDVKKLVGIEGELIRLQLPLHNMLKVCFRTLHHCCAGDWA